MSEVVSNILKKVDGIDPVKRDELNGIYLTQHKDECFPLNCGWCTSIDTVTDCGIFKCFGCDNFTCEVTTYDDMIIKSYEHIYNFKRRNSMKTVLPDFEDKIRRIYNNQGLSDKEVKSHINKLKKIARKG